MHLDPSGHPLHSRALKVRLMARQDGKLDVHGYLLDLRKRGFVPVAGELQGPGIVHHMLLDGVVDTGARILESIVAGQPSVAFEPSALTKGESCRDPIRRIEALAGSRLDPGFARRISGELGGPRGCSHILTLGHLLGSTVAWALDQGAADGRWAPGERVFERDVIVDGHEPQAGTMQLSVQLNDMLFRPAAAVARPMDRFDRQREVRALATLEMQEIAITAIRAAERMRGLEDLESAPWHDRSVSVQGLVGARIFAGMAAALLQQLGGETEHRPLLDALLMLAPAFVQCSAALSEAWAAIFKNSPSVVAMGGFSDSCYMWRRGGALDEVRATEDPAPRLW